MSAHWIILLDESGSMFQPFTGGHAFSGHTETGAYRTKIEAAKDRLLREINGLQNCIVSIISFSSDAAVICSELSSEVATIRKLLDRPRDHGGGTNIAAALDAALIAAKRQESATFTSILLISDGLSNEGDPIEAARRCASARVPISTILIDPTPEGERCAREISIGGRVSGVATEIDFARAMESAADAHAEAASHVPIQSALLGIVAGFAAVLGAAISLTGVIAKTVESPSVALPITVAALCIIASSGLFWVAYARTKWERGIYLSSNLNDIHYPIEYRFEKRTRIAAFFTGLGALAGAGLLLQLSWVSHADELSKRILWEQNWRTVSAYSDFPGMMKQGLRIGPGLIAALNTLDFSTDETLENKRQVLLATIDLGVNAPLNDWSPDEFASIQYQLEEFINCVRKKAVVNGAIK